MEYNNLYFDFDWIYRARINALDDIYFYSEEQEALVKKLKIVRQKLKDAEKKYKECWELWEDKKREV